MSSFKKWYNQESFYRPDNKELFWICILSLVAIIIKLLQEFNIINVYF